MDQFDIAKASHSRSLNDTPGADSSCIQCGYALEGLSISGRCPECGTPVERSLRGNQLVHSSHDFLVKLHRGVRIALAAIVFQVVLTVSMIIISVNLALSRAGASTASTKILEVVNESFSLGITVMALVGWWLFSAPDPLFKGKERGTTARKVVRGSLVVEFAFRLVSVIGVLCAAVGVNPQLTDPIVMASGIAVLIAWPTRFFATMLYVRWLAPRIPNQRVYKRAGLLMWLGPVLCTVCALTLIGPLIALVLYWNMLYWVQQDLKKIMNQPRRTRRPMIPTP